MRTADLEEAAGNNSAWLTYGRDYSGQRYVELDQITPANVDRLHPAWVFATGGENRGLEATPLIHEGVLYVSADGSRVFAIDARTGAKKALSLQLSGVQDVVAVKDAMGAPHAIVSVIASLPLAGVVTPLFCLISLVFLATTYDSASYALAASASTKLSEGQAPGRRHRLLWAVLLAVLPTALLAGDAGGGRLRSMQTASLIASAPLLLIFIVTAFSLAKALHEDERGA